MASPFSTNELFLRSDRIAFGKVPPEVQSREERLLIVPDLPGYTLYFGLSSLISTNAISGTLEDIYPQYASFSFDNLNKRLGIAVSTPQYGLDIATTTGVRISGGMLIANAFGLQSVPTAALISTLPSYVFAPGTIPPTAIASTGSINGISVPTSALFSTIPTQLFAPSSIPLLSLQSSGVIYTSSVFANSLYGDGYNISNIPLANINGNITGNFFKPNTIPLSSLASTGQIWIRDGSLFVPTFSTAQAFTSSLNVNTVDAQQITTGNVIASSFTAGVLNLTNISSSSLTTSSIRVNGGVIANTFSGDGCNLTNLSPAALNTVIPSDKFGYRLIAWTAINPYGNFEWIAGSVIFRPLAPVTIQGTLNVVGVTSLNIVTANLFAGNGSGLYNLNAISSLSLQSTITGLASIGYISSSQLQSTVIGLSNLIDAGIDQRELTSSLMGLGTLGYVSTFSLQSTLEGLGSAGYISSSQLTSTVAGINTFLVSTTFGLIELPELVSTTFGIDNSLISTTSGINTSLISTTFGLVEVPELVSTTFGLNTSLISTTSGINTSLISTTFGLVEVPELVSTTFGLNTSLISTTSGINTSLISTTFGIDTALISTTFGLVEVPELVSTTFGVNNSLISTTSGLNTSLISTTFGIDTALISTTFGLVEVPELVSTTFGVNNSLISTTSGINTSLISTTFGLVEVPELVSTTFGINTSLISTTFGLVEVPELVSTTFGINTSLISTTFGLVEVPELVSSVAGINTSLISTTFGLVEVPELISTVAGLGTAGYVSTLSLRSSIISTTNYTDVAISSFSTAYGPGGISPAILTSTITGLGSSGYISSSQLVSTTAGLEFYISTFIDTTELASTITSTVFGLGIENAFISSTQGLGSAGYISSSQLVSTTAGLEFYISTFIDPTELASTITSTVFGLGVESAFISSTKGLGSAGYISSLSLTSSIVSTTNYINFAISSFSTAFGPGGVAPGDIVSTTKGLGSAGYISSLQLVSTTAGLELYISSFIDPQELASSVLQFISTTYLTSQLTSTVAGLGTAGYVSTASLTSTVAGINTSLISTTFGLVEVPELVSTTFGINTSLISTTFGLVEVPELVSSVAGINTSLISTTFGLVEVPELVSTIVGLGSAGYVSTASLISTTNFIGLSISSFSTAFGPGGIALSNITSTVEGLGSAGYVSTLSLNSTTSFFQDEIAAGFSSLSTAIRTSPAYNAQLLYLNQSVDVAPYKELSINEIITTTLYSTITSIPGNTDSNLLCAFQTDFDLPTFIPSGIWDLNLFVDAGVANAILFYYNLYFRASSGVETLLYQSRTVPVGNTGIQQYTNSLPVNYTPITNGSTIVLKVYGSNYVSPTRTVTCYFQDSYYSHVHTTFSPVSYSGGSGISSLSTTVGNNYNYFSTQIVSTNTNLFSTVIGLGSAGYVSSLSLLSTTIAFQTAGFLSSPNLNSTVVGLGSAGYISSSQLISTTFGLVEVPELISSVAGINTSLISTTFGLVEVPELISSVAGINTSLISTTFGLVEVPELISSVAGINTSLISTTFGLVEVPELISSVAGINTSLISTTFALVEVPELISSVVGLGSVGYVSSLSNVRVVSTQQLFVSTINGFQYTPASGIPPFLSSFTVSSGSVFASSIQGIAISSQQIFTSSLIANAITTSTSLISTLSTNLINFAGGFGYLTMPDIYPNTVYTSTVTASNLLVGWNSVISPIQFYGFGTYSNTVISELSTGATTQELVFFRGSNASDRIRMQTTGSIVFEPGVSARIWPTVPSNVTPAMLINTSSNVGIQTATPATALDVAGTGRFQILSTLNINLSSVNGLAYGSGGGITTANLTSSIVGLGSAGYVSTASLISTTNFIGLSISSFSTAFGPGGGGTLTLGNLTSTVGGLGQIYISTGGGGITTANLTSSIVGLGSAGYVSTASLISTTNFIGLSISSFSTAFGPPGGGSLTTANLTSTVGGLGQIYLSTGGGGGITSIPPFLSSFTVSTGSIVASSIRANFFIGDGSQLTNLQVSIPSSVYTNQQYSFFTVSSGTAYTGQPWTSQLMTLSTVRSNVAPIYLDTNGITMRVSTLSPQVFRISYMTGGNQNTLTTPRPTITMSVSTATSQVFYPSVENFEGGGGSVSFMETLDSNSQVLFYMRGLSNYTFTPSDSYLYRMTFETVAGSVPDILSSINTWTNFNNFTSSVTFGNNITVTNSTIANAGQFNYLRVMCNALVGPGTITMSNDNITASNIQLSSINLYDQSTMTYKAMVISSGSIYLGGTLASAGGGGGTTVPGGSTLSSLFVGSSSNQNFIKFWGSIGNYNDAVIAQQSTGGVTGEILTFKGSSINDQIRFQTTGSVRFETGVSAPRNFNTANQLTTPTVLINSSSNVGILTNNPSFTLDVTGSGRFTTLMSTTNLYAGALYMGLFFA